MIGKGSWSYKAEYFSWYYYGFILFHLFMIFTTGSCFVVWQEKVN
jgi:hypothetical protein